MSCFHNFTKSILVLIFDTSLFRASIALISLMFVPTANDASFAIRLIRLNNPTGSASDGDNSLNKFWWMVADPGMDIKEPDDNDVPKLPKSWLRFLSIVEDLGTDINVDIKEFGV